MTTSPSSPNRGGNSGGSLPLGHELVEGELHHAIVIYGTDDSIGTLRSRALLDDLGIEYNYKNIQLDEAMARTASALQGGGIRIPVLDFGEDRVLIEPTDDVLRQALLDTGRIRG